MALSKVNPNFVNVSQYGRRNIIINGAMQVAQRGTSNTTDGGYCVDRFKNQLGGGARTFEQETLSSSTDATVWNLGFRNAVKITNTTAGSTSTTDYTELNYWIEAQDIANSGWNYLDENSYLTLSFWVKSSVAADYLLWARCEDNTALKITQSFTVSSANTWEKIILKIKGNSGLIFNNDSGAGLRLGVFVYEGTNYTDGSPENTWQNGTPNSPSSTWSTTTNATFHVTGVQLEVGDTATPFEHRSFAEELQLCKRYYQRYGGDDTFEHLPFYVMGNSTVANFNWGLPVEMRTVPSLSTAGTWSIQGPFGGSVYTVGGFALANTSAKTIRGDVTSLSGSIGTNVARIFALNNTAVRFNLSAEF
jgi:hypothetical protein